MAPPRANRLPSLSDKEAIVLDLLRQGPALYGLQLVALSDGRLKRGTVYVTLGRMEAKGYVAAVNEAKPATDKSPRRLYRPTALGLRVAHAWSTLAHALRTAEAM